MSPTALLTAPAVEVDELDVDSPPGSQPWTLSFTFDDPTHCFGAIEDCVSDLGDAVRAALELPSDLTGFDHDDLQRACQAAAAKVEQDLEDPGPEADISALELVLDALEDAAAALKPHGSCMCPSDAWDIEEEYFNEEIDLSAPDTIWAVFDVQDRPLATLTESPTVDALWHAVNRRDGWGSVELTWDPTGRSVTFAFGSYPGMWHGKAIALTEEQKHLVADLEALDGAFDTLACLATTADPFALHVLVNLWGDDDEEDLTSLVHLHTGDLEAALGAVTEQMKDLTGPARAVAATLSAGWHSSLADLVMAAATITT